MIIFQSVDLRSPPNELHQAQSNQQRKEEINSIAISDKNDFVLVGVMSNYLLCSRNMIFGIKTNRFVLKATIDLLSERLCYVSAMSCCGYYASHILWIGLEFREKEARSQIYDYNIKDGSLRELKDTNISIQAVWVCNVRRMGKSFYYTSNFGEGKLMKLSIHF